jgi:hypothetical protein
MDRPEMQAGLGALFEMLDALTGPYIPPPYEVALLEAGLAKLIAAYELRDFEPGEEAVWNCGTITIAGEHKGAWEIRLRQTDAPSPDHIPKGGDA